MFIAAVSTSPTSPSHRQPSGSVASGRADRARPAWRPAKTHRRRPGAAGPGRARILGVAYPVGITLHRSSTGAGPLASPACRRGPRRASHTGGIAVKSRPARRSRMPDHQNLPHIAPPMAASLHRSARRDRASRPCCGVVCSSSSSSPSSAAGRRRADGTLQVQPRADIRTRDVGDTQIPRPTRIWDDATR